jgi:hypothetical protein
MSGGDRPSRQERVPVYLTPLFSDITTGWPTTLRRKSLGEPVVVLVAVAAATASDI